MKSELLENPKQKRMQELLEAELGDVDIDENLSISDLFMNLLQFSYNPVLMMDCLKRINYLGSRMEGKDFMKQINSNIIYFIRSRLFCFVFDNDIFNFFYLVSIGIDDSNSEIFQALIDIGILDFYYNSLSNKNTSTINQEFILLSSGNFVIKSNDFNKYFCESRLFQYILEFVPKDLIIKERVIWLLSSVFAFLNQYVQQKALVIFDYLKNELFGVDIDIIRQQCLKGFISSNINYSDTLLGYFNDDIIDLLLKLLYLESIKTKRLLIHLINILCSKNTNLLYNIDINLILNNLEINENKIIIECFDFLKLYVSSQSETNDFIDYFNYKKVFDFFYEKDFLAKIALLKFLEFLCNSGKINLISQLISKKLIDLLIDMGDSLDSSVILQIIHLFFFISTRIDDITIYFVKSIFENNNILDFLLNSSSLFTKEQQDDIKLFLNRVFSIKNSL